MLRGLTAAATRWPVWALIREVRRRARITQSALARRVGTSQPAIARYERARAMPDLDTLHRIVEACGLELRLELAEPDPQRAAGERIALERTPEERLEANSRQAALVHALRNA
jgi:transcriptional regulator with XRE-family HTH domain